MKNIKDFIKESFKIGINKMVDTYKIDKEKPQFWEVGDILYGTRGYTMTLPCFFRIKKKTPKGFTIVELEEKIVSGHRNGQWKSVADLEGEESKPANVRINKWGSVKLDRTYLHYWDGKPVCGDDMD